MLVHGLSMEPLGALTALAVIAEHDSEPVWKSLLELSGEQQHHLTLSHLSWTKQTFGFLCKPANM